MAGLGMGRHLAARSPSPSGPARPFRIDAQNQAGSGSLVAPGPIAARTSSTSRGPSTSSIGWSAANRSAASVKVLVVTKNPLWLPVWWIVPRNFWSSGEPTTPFLWYLHWTTPRSPSRRTRRSAPSSPVPPTRSTS